ncbi:MAG: rod shape-determining protein RodA [Pseudanabaenaceae cyanobacterium]
MITDNWQLWKRRWEDIDWALLFIPVFLTIIGGVVIYSTDFQRGQINWLQHWITGLVGLGLGWVVSKVTYDCLRQWHWFIYITTNLVLLAVLFFGTRALGAERWLNIFGFHLQPSEFAKVAMIISLAAIFHEQPIAHPLDMLRAVWLVTPPVVLILLQPNLGTALVFIAITTGMLYWAGARLGWLVLLISPIVGAILYNFSLLGWYGWVGLMGITAWFSLPWFRLPATVVALAINLISGQIGHVLWGLLHDYQKQRLLLFLDPTQDPLGGGYHLIQSRIAIGAGKLWGKGLLNGTQTQLSFIPEQHTDFIFSAIGEELGFVGCITVLLLFTILCWRLLVIAHHAKDNFGSLLAIGVFSFILFQSFVNIGMNIGIAPVTGIPLPWLSYGRSAMLANFLAIAVVASVVSHNRTIKF